VKPGTVPLSERWHDLDAAPDPIAFVHYLQHLSAHQWVQAYKRRTIELLELRPGQSALDIGCGVADEVRAMAALVGPSGRAVGVDTSETMLAEACRRTAPDLCATFELGDAQALPFPDATFDACRADRVLEHLVAPDRAVAELYRVARPGARIVLVEPDWATLVVDHPNLDLTRRILTRRADMPRSPWVGRQLRRLLTVAGCHDVQVWMDSLVCTAFAEADAVLGLGVGAHRAAELGGATHAEVATWLSSLEAADEAGHFLASLSGFFAVGIKAAP
jgi:SAM-dependent methyltransferase